MLLVVLFCVFQFCGLGASVWVARGSLEAAAGAKERFNATQPPSLRPADHAPARLVRPQPLRPVPGAVGLGPIGPPRKRDKTWTSDEKETKLGTSEDKEPKLESPKTKKHTHTHTHTVAEL